MKKSIEGKRHAANAHARLGAGTAGVYARDPALVLKTAEEVKR